MTRHSPDFLPEARGAAGASPHVIIIGGGASGVLLAVQLLSRRDGNFFVSIVEPRPRVGLGLAYSTRDDDHLLNTRAQHMSALADQPGHFLAWLARNDLFADPDAFVSRSIYGRYLAGLLAPWQQGEDKRRLRLVTATCTALGEHMDGVVAHLDNGTVLIGELAVLATGHTAPAAVPGSALTDPWTAPAPIDPGDTVAILGTGLSMVDHVLTLLNAGHSGPILALSRRGLLPRDHAPTRPLTLRLEDLPLGATASATLRWMRGLARLAEAPGGTWRDAVDGIRPHVRRLWRSLPQAERARFLRHAAPWWDVHRHRIPPASARRLTEALASGQLTILRGAHVAASPAGGAIDLTWRPYRQREPQVLRVARVIDCRGLRGDPAATASPVIRDLLGRGAARVDPLRLGLDTDSDGRLKRQDGSTAWRIRAIGPVTRAAFWEITAIPDIREQAARMAADLSELARRTDPAHEITGVPV